MYLYKAIEYNIPVEAIVKNIHQFNKITRGQIVKWVKGPKSFLDSKYIQIMKDSPLIELDDPNKIIKELL